MTTTRWQSWHAAFEEAGKLPAQDGRPLTLTLAPEDFARALRELLIANDELGTPDTERHQGACRTGQLAWWDARGRCVLIAREGWRRSARRSGCG